jgi:hypothetical protein
MSGFGSIYMHEDIPVCDETNWKQFSKIISSSGTSETGYIGRDKRVVPLASQPGTTRMPAELIIPLEELPDRIADRKRKREGLRYIIESMPPFWLNQDPTNSCWGFGPVHGQMLLYGLMNRPFVRLSPFSITGPINRYRDVGGWGSSALKLMISEGVASDEFWPFSKPGMSRSDINRANRNAIVNGRQYYEGSRANAAQNKITEAWDLASFDEKISALLRDMPVPDGYNYEGHETCSIDVDIIDGKVSTLELDSYTWDGRPHLRWRKGERFAFGDDPIALRVGTA